jgi:hypothetical protein
MQTASRVVELINAEDPDVVCLDGNGVGGGVVDRVRDLVGRERARTIFEVQNGSKATNERDFYNKRAECWGHLKEWLEIGAIDGDPLLRDDLIGPEYGYDLQNRLQLERKDKMKNRGLHSPDDADALALTFAVSVGRRPQKEKVKPRLVVAHARGTITSGAWMN